MTGAPLLLLPSNLWLVAVAQHRAFPGIGGACLFEPTMRTKERCR